MVITATILPGNHSNFNAISDGEFREMDINTWSSQGQTLEEAEEFCDLAEGGFDDINSDRFDELSHKMAEFHVEEKRKQEEKRQSRLERWGFYIFGNILSKVLN